MALQVKDLNDPKVEMDYQCVKSPANISAEKYDIDDCERSMRAELPAEQRASSRSLSMFGFGTMVIKPRSIGGRR